MKRILIGDTHLGIKKGNDLYLQIFQNLINEICEYSKKNEIKEIIILGDFFDTRKSLSLNVIDIALDSMNTLSDTFDNIYIIIGNHDTFLKSQLHPTSLSIFKKHNNVHIVDEPYELENILLLPWLFDIDVLKTSNKDICMGHFDINGIEMNVSGFTQLSCKLNISDFKKFKKVFSGHYHISSKTNNIQYLGSPIQFTFNEINTKTGYYVFDNDTLKLKFIEFTEYPKHVIITDEFIPDKSIQGNNIKLIFNKDYGVNDNTLIINNILNKNPNNLNILYNIGNGMNKEVIDDDIKMLSKIDILHEYHKKSELNENISNKLLSKITDKIYKNCIGE